MTKASRTLRHPESRSSQPGSIWPSDKTLFLQCLEEVLAASAGDQVPAARLKSKHPKYNQHQERKILLRLHPEATENEYAPARLNSYADTLTQWVGAKCENFIPPELRLRCEKSIIGQLINPINDVSESPSIFRDAAKQAATMIRSRLTEKPTDSAALTKSLEDSLHLSTALYLIDSGLIATYTGATLLSNALELTENPQHQCPDKRRKLIHAVRTGTPIKIEMHSKAAQIINRHIATAPPLLEQ